MQSCLRSPSSLSRTRTLHSVLRLRMEDGSGAGEIFEITNSKCTIGSAPGCTIRLNESMVRPVHALILRSEKKAVLERWAEETWLNGETFETAILNPGDLLTIGTVTFSVWESELEVETSVSSDLSDERIQTAAPVIEPDVLPTQAPETSPVPQDSPKKTTDGLFARLTHQPLRFDLPPQETSIDLTNVAEVLKPTVEASTNQQDRNHWKKRTLRLLTSLRTGRKELSDQAKKINELHEHLITSEAQLRETQERIAHLEHEVASHDPQAIERLSEQMRNLESQLGEFQTNEVQLKETIQKLESDLQIAVSAKAEIQESYDETKEDLSEASLQVENAFGTLKEWESKVEALNQLLAERDTTIETIQKTMEQLERESSSEAIDLELWLAKEVDWNAERQQWAMERDAWNSDREGWHVDHETWRVERTSWENEREAFEKQKKAWHAERKSLEALLEKSANELMQQITKFDSLRHNIQAEQTECLREREAEWDRQRAEWIAERRHWEAERAGWENEREQWEIETQTFEEQRAEWENKLQASEAERDAWIDKCNQRDKETESFETLRTELESKLQATEAERDAWFIECEAREQKSQAFETYRADWEAKLQILESERAAWEEQREQWEETSKAFDTNRSEWEAKLQTVEAERDAWLNECEQLESRLQESEAERNYISDLPQATNQNEEVTSELEAQLDALKAENQMLVSSLESAVADWHAERKNHEEQITALQAKASTVELTEEFIDEPNFDGAVEADILAEDSPELTEPLIASTESESEDSADAEAEAAISRLMALNIWNELPSGNQSSETDDTESDPEWESEESSIDWNPEENAAEATEPTAFSTFEEPAPDDDSEEALEAYMSRLMQRLRGENPQLEAVPKASVPKQKASKQSSTSNDLKSAKEKESKTTANEPALEMSQPSKLNSIEEMHRPEAQPARSDNFEALRELANHSTRSALNLHQGKVYRDRVWSKFSVSGVSVAAGLVLIQWSQANHGYQFYSGWACIVAGVVWALETTRIGLRTYRKGKQLRMISLKELAEEVEHSKQETE